MKCNYSDFNHFSHAINTYIISKYAKNDKLYPTDLLKRARIDQRLHFDSALFVRGYDILKPIFVDSATEISQGQKDALDRGYQLLELFLESGTYLVGDSLSVADLSCAAFIESAKGMSEISDKKFVVITIHILKKKLITLPVSRYPKIIAWLDRLSMELPYYNEMNRKNAENHINMFRAIMQKNKSNAEKK